jgi:exodeoxyribonuclease VII large subunit
MQEYVQPEIDTDGNIVYSVEECVFLINEAVARLGMVRVRGEISSLSLSKGIMAFFDLKDAGGKESVVQCSLFGWNFSKYKHLLEDGMEVVIRGHLKVYEKRGTLSLIVESMEPSGEGAWRRAFEALKRKLEAKGYFEKSRKREIPQFVQKIGLITSEESGKLWLSSILEKRMG